MWLLHTSTGELRWFNPKEHVPYAILSHVWTDHEDDFQHIRSGGLAHATDKVKRFCEFARARGYEWAWVDTCCIDKTSSAELSEAINSMFEWYQSASECVAFLADVPENENPISLNSAFRRSRWFTRGWTLQELIAPREVLFLGDHWHILGSKHSMRVTVDEITGVAADVLTHVTSVDAISVAERMSWAAQRNTTRVEDEAYSLMGLFGVFMPTVYGEGRSAFIRLQEEILKTIADDSLFTWGPLATVHTDVRHRARDTPSVKTSGTPWEEDCEQLFAVSPRQFAGCKGIVSLSSGEFVRSLRRLRHAGALTSAGHNLRAGDLAVINSKYIRNHFTITGHGVRAHIPVGDFEGTVAILACSTGVEADDVIGLALTRMPAEEGRYLVGNTSSNERWRILRIPLWFDRVSNKLRLLGHMVEMTIVHRQTRHLRDKIPPRIVYWPRCEIFIASWIFYSLLDQGFHLSLFMTSRLPLADAVPEPVVFAPIIEPPRFKLSQLTGSFATLCLTHPRHRADIRIVITPCSALLQIPDYSVPFHLGVTVTKTKAYADDDRGMSLSSPGPSNLQYPVANVPCASTHENGKCTIRTLRLEELQEFATPTNSPWVVQISCQRISSGEIDMYSLEIGVRNLPEDEIVKARTSSASPPRGAGETDSNPLSQHSVLQERSHSDALPQRPGGSVGGEDGVHDCTQPGAGEHIMEISRAESTRVSEARRGLPWKMSQLLRKKS